MTTNGVRIDLRQQATDEVDGRGHRVARIERDAAVEACRRALARSAQARAEEILQDVLAGIFEELPAYSQGRPSSELDEVSSGVARSIAMSLRAIEDRRRLSDDELVGLHLVGAQRGRQGIPRDALLRTVKIGTRVGRLCFFRCADPATDPEVLLDTFHQIGEVLDWYEDDATTALAGGYDEGLRSAVPPDGRGEAIVVDRLLEQRFRDDGDMERQAGDIGLLPSRVARVLVVVSTEGTDHERLRETVADIDRSAPCALGPVRLTHRAHLPAVVQPKCEADWEVLVEALDERAIRLGTIVVFAERPAPLLDAGEPYRQIQQGLPFLAAAVGRPGTVSATILRFHRVMLGGTAADRRRFAEEVLQPFDALPAREQSELFETLDALFDTGGSASVLATHLHLHRNTVLNRLRRIAEVTGLDVRRPAHRLVLETVSCMRRLAEADALPSEPGEWWATRSP